MREWAAWVIGKLKKSKIRLYICSLCCSHNNNLEYLSDDNIPKYDLQHKTNVKTSNSRYYGNGIQKQECGMTIEEPTAVDRSEWKCYIGYSEGANLKTMGAILDASDTTTDPGDGESVPLDGLCFH